MVQVDWRGNMAFDVTPPSGAKFTLDLRPDMGGEGKGPSPGEALLAAIAGCTAMDVVSILKNKKQTLTSYRIEIDGEKPPEGEYPRPFLTISVKHILAGPDLDPTAVARAIELSDDKYCSVMATLRATPAISTSWEIEDEVSLSGSESGRR